MSIEEVQKKRVFVSFLVCIDELNRTIIVGTGSPYLLTYRNAFIETAKEIRVPIMAAVKKARLRGEMIPKPDDLVTTKKVRLRVVGINGLDTRTPLNVYFYNI
jgi:hypothetical protein